MTAPQPSRSLNSLPIVLVLTWADPIAVGVLVAAVIVVVVVTVQTGAHRCSTDGGGSITGTAPTIARIPGYRTARHTSDRARRADLRSGDALLDVKAEVLRPRDSRDRPGNHEHVCHHRHVCHHLHHREIRHLHHGGQMRHQEPDWQRRG